MALEKVNCVSCEGGFFVNPAEVEIPEGVKTGEAFPCFCPFCNENRYAVLPEKEK